MLAQPLDVLSPSQAAIENAERGLYFVMQRRQRERDAAAQRVRCNFRRRGKWTRTKYVRELDRDAARTVIRALLRFGILQRTRRRLRARRRRRALRVIARFAARLRSDRQARVAAAAALVILERHAAAALLGTHARRFARRRLVRRAEAAARVEVWALKWRERHRVRLGLAARETAVRTLQSATRRHLVRKRVVRRRAAVATIHACALSWRRLRQARAARLATAATSIERTCRGFTERRRYGARLVVHRDTLRRSRLTAAAETLQRPARVLLARRWVKVRDCERRRVALQRASASAVTVYAYLHVLKAAAVRRELERKLVEARARSAMKITGFARGVIAKARVRRIVHRRAMAAAAATAQRIWRGALGRARFERIKAESYRCRRCKAMEYGGRYCKKCGFARYAHSPINVDWGDSPYAPRRVRPSFVKKLRNSVARATGKKPGETSFLPIVRLAQRRPSILSSLGEGVSENEAR